MRTPTRLIRCMGRRRSHEWHGLESHGRRGWLTLDAKLVTEQNEPALRQCLERILPRVSNRQSDIAAIHSRQSDTSTSYETDILTVQLADGGVFKVFLKNYGVFKRPKDEMGQRRAREVRVYQDLLEYANLGTPRYYGTVWDESQ